MPSLVTESSKAWDFGPVYDLLRNLSSPSPAPPPLDDGTKKTTSKSKPVLASKTELCERPANSRTESESLGDFRALWDYLGVDPKKLPPEVKKPDGLLHGSVQVNDFGQNAQPLSKPEQHVTPSKSVLKKKARKESFLEPVTVSIQANRDYTSDGGVYQEPRQSSVAWNDLTDALDTAGDSTSSELPADTGESADDATPVASKGTTKVGQAGAGARSLVKAERKARKKAKKEAQKLVRQQAQAKAVSDIEPDTLDRSPKKTPARKASIHPISVESSTPKPGQPRRQYDLRSLASGSTPVVKYESDDLPEVPTPSKKSKKKNKQSVDIKKVPTSVPVEPVTPKKPCGATPSTPRPKASWLPITKYDETAISPQTQPGDKTPLPSQSQSHSQPETHAPSGQAEVSPASYADLYKSSGASKAGQKQKIAPLTTKPSKVQSQPLPQTPKPKSAPQPVELSKAPATISAPRHGQTPGRSSPLNIRKGEDRHMHFFLELIKQFPLDKRWLVSPAQLSTHASNDKGIHVFVDSSNIFIGFKEYIRRAFGLPWGRQVAGLDISFDSLVLLMERRRPVAKRVLVGSYPNIPAYDMAKAVGYETNLLDQVYKDRDLSKQQKRQFYRARDGRENGLVPTTPNYGGGYASAGTGSASETASGPGAAAATPSSSLPSAQNAQKWVEQGVDEIIHLKMLESIVDADEPGTMVLATGDAAVAEYSQGFLKMVERALKKGWSVELMSWKVGINSAYVNAGFRKKWGEKFRVVELDAWVEDLIDS